MLHITRPKQSGQKTIDPYKNFTKKVELNLDPKTPHG
jgi:hypothetical protein